MMRPAARVWFFLLLLAVVASGQVRRRDPLNEAETDQLRETAQEPALRLKLYAKLARARMLAVDQVRADPKLAAERGQRLHDLLDDVAILVDEMDDNIAQYHKQQADIRKPLAEIVQMDDDFVLRLRGLKEAATADPAAVRAATQYKFVLEDALEAVTASADSARQTLDEQNRMIEEKKKNKKKK